MLSACSDLARDLIASSLFEASTASSASSNVVPAKTPLNDAGSNTEDSGVVGEYPVANQ